MQGQGPAQCIPALPRPPRLPPAPFPMSAWPAGQLLTKVSFVIYTPVLLQNLDYLLV
jgi:hypothetical protein